MGQDAPLGRGLRHVDRDLRRPGCARRGSEHGADARRPGPSHRQQTRVPVRRSATRGHRDALLSEKSFVKRVIAEEHDVVRIVDGRVYVNDVPLRDDYVAPEFRDHDDYGPELVPEGYYFVLGDHRNNSSDSRHWGMVPKKYIIGKVQVRWWPVPSARVF